MTLGSPSLCRQPTFSLALFHISLKDKDVHVHAKLHSPEPDCRFCPPQLVHASEQPMVAQEQPMVEGNSDGKVVASSCRR